VSFFLVSFHVLTVRDPLWFRATYNPVFNSDGQLYKIVKFATDVTADVLRNQREQEAAVHAWDMAVQTRGSAQNGANVIENSILMIDRIAQGMGAVSTDVPGSTISLKVLTIWWKPSGSLPCKQDLLH
jgi:hypothetical protein